MIFQNIWLKTKFALLGSGIRNFSEGECKKGAVQIALGSTALNTLGSGLDFELLKTSGFLSIIASVGFLSSGFMNLKRSAWKKGAVQLFAGILATLPLCATSGRAVEELFPSMVLAGVVSAIAEDLWNHRKAIGDSLIHTADAAGRIISICKNFSSNQTINRLAACAFSLPLLYSTFTIGPILEEGIGICLPALFPRGTKEFFRHVAKNYLPATRFFPSNNASTIVHSVILEELDFRVLFQEIFLKKIPKNLIQKISPNHASLTNHILARIARVATSSLFFALYHPQVYSCLNPRFTTYFMGGVIFGTFQEVSGHPLYNTLAHIIHNSVAYHFYFKN
ncbi:MAG: CPBP family glutamic-type intramembrane protease [Chlamydiota bacterium]